MARRSRRKWPSGSLRAARNLRDGFLAYFLVVWDIIRYARESGIRVGPGDGSAADAASPTAAAHRSISTRSASDLLVRAFLNSGRKQMPDIDMDFDEAAGAR